MDNLPVQATDTSTDGKRFEIGASSVFLFMIAEL